MESSQSDLKKIHWEKLKFEEATYTIVDSQDSLEVTVVQEKGGWWDPWLGFGASPVPTKTFFLTVAQLSLVVTGSGLSLTYIIVCIPI